MDFAHDAVTTVLVMRNLTVGNIFRRFSPATVPGSNFRALDVAKMPERTFGKAEGACERRYQPVLTQPSKATGVQQGHPFVAGTIRIDSLDLARRAP